MPSVPKSKQPRTLKNQSRAKSKTIASVKRAISVKGKKKIVPDLSGDTEARILKAAREEFLNRGLNGARMRSIAASAGVNPALPNYYFRSKDALYAAALRDTLQRVWGELQSAANHLPPNASLEILLREFLTRYLTLLGANPDFPRFMMREMIDGGAHLATAIQQVKKSFSGIPQLIYGSIQREIAAGKIRPVDPFHLILNVAGMAMITVIFRIIAPRLDAELGLNFPTGSDFQQKRIDSILTTLLQGLRIST